jgi:hypothetical protein
MPRMAPVLHPVTSRALAVAACAWLLACAAAGAQPRPKPEPQSRAVERNPALRLTPELSTPVTEDPQRRQAAAALWQVLQKGPDQVVQERAEADARSDRTTATLLAIGLSLLVLTSLGYLGWRWYRDARRARVGRSLQARGGPAQVPVPAVDAPTAAAPRVPTRPSVISPAAPAGTVVPGAKAKASRPRDAGATSGWFAPEDYQPSRGGAIRMVGIEELIDVHSKADFFLAIGEPAQAVALLESHVHDQLETSALTWMDLLELYHSLGKRLEYERLRREFQQRFSAPVPDFEHFDQPAASLEDYSVALGRIVALWPSRRVFDLIEELIFRQPGLAGAEAFSLKAYRELVLLYHIAREVAFGPEGWARLEPTVPERDRLMIPPASPHIGVDINLFDEEGAPARGPGLDFDITGFETADAVAAKAERTGG